MIQEKAIKVLIVDDDPLILDAISFMLKEVGFSPITCNNAKDAITLMKKDSFDTVLSDIKMHGLSGFELLEKIKEVNSELPVILMTGYADVDNAINAIKKGAFDFITKPFIPEHLIQSLKKAVKYHDLILTEIKHKKELELTNEALKNEINKSKFLQEQNIIFRQFAEASGQGMGMADLEGNVTYTNPALSRIIGITKTEDTCQINIRKYYSEEDLPKLENEILPEVFERGHKTLEIPLISANGNITPTIQSIFLIRDEHGKPFYLANVVTDISERKRIENELRDHHDRLEELVTERTEALNERVQDLEKFYEMSVGREMRMIELKKRISQLESELSDYREAKNNINQNNCWEYWDCLPERRNDCPAYKLNSGRSCFDLARNYCPRVGREYDNCWECPWYKIVKSDVKSEKVEGT